MPHCQKIETALRRSFERARALSAEQQIGECIDQLQHPAVLVAEVLDAYAQMRSEFQDEASEPKKVASSDERQTTLVEKFIWEARDLMVLGDKCSFTCLATNLNPLSAPASCGDDPAPQASEASLSSGIDYVGLTCDSEAVLVLGAVQAPGDATAYPLLLRLLACLSEIAPPAQLERMNRDHFKGMLAGGSDAEPRFDLNLVLWQRQDEPEMTPISQLTRDLAEKVKAGLQQAEEPTLLRDIVCLRMNSDRFDGRMRFDWRV